MEKGEETMGYGFEAFVILLAVLFPLGCVVWFLGGLIGSLEEENTTKPLQDEEKQ